MVPTYVLTRRIFLRLLGMVWLLAFASLATQIMGLVGERGIMPAGRFLEWAHSIYGAQAWWQMPTVFWLGAGDTALRLAAWSGVALSLLLVAGVAPGAVLLLLWALYLSLSVAGQDFLSFQWDALLLETGLLAALWAPAGGLLGRGERRPSELARLLLVFLLFKLMFLSGATKLLSGDPTWRGGTALDFHFETQPLPPWTAWYAHHLPPGVHQALTGFTLVVEVLVPWLLLLPSRLRALRIGAAAVIALLQVGIAVTGNYGFFNLLTLVLCVPLVDDAALGRLGLRRDDGELPDPSPLARTLHRVAFPLLLLLSGLSLVRELAFTDPTGRGRLWWPGWANTTMELVAPLRSINGYGLFRVMTIDRPELILEGSADGERWVAYDFRYKPDDPLQRPRIVAPLHPRLDWQLWFAALAPAQSLPWLETLAERLRAGTPEVLDLLGENPFSNAPPRYVRVVLYDYRFSTREEHGRTGAWWVREERGVFSLEGIARHDERGEIAGPGGGASTSAAGRSSQFSNTTANQLARPRMSRPTTHPEPPMRPIVFLTSLALATACSETTSPPTAMAPAAEAAAHRKPDLRSVRQALIEAGNKVSAAIATHGVAQGLGGALTANTVLLFPRKDAIRGRAEATAFLAGDPLAPSELSWEVIFADVSADASHGFTWSQGSSTIDLGAGATPFPSFFLIYWRRTEGGSWRIAAFVLNRGEPQTAPFPKGFGTPDKKHGKPFHRGDVKDFRRQLLAVDAAFSAASVKNGSGPAFERFAAPKAIAVGGPLIFGPEAIGEAFASAPGDVISWAPRFVDAAASGDLGFTVGDASFDLATSPDFYTKYLTIWQRQKNGKWRFIADLGNSRPAPTP